MRTLTVKETAKVLGVSVRTIQSRLQTEELKGKRVKNQFGVLEWRVWPTKEIEEKASLMGLLDELNFDTPTEEFQGGDASAVLDAETTDVDQTYFEETPAPMMAVIREMTQMFGEQLSREKHLNFQLQRELEDKDRQLKLLPDFEKQAADRKAEAEAKELEAIALAKQIEAMNAKTAEAVAGAARLAQLETEVLPTLEGQLAQERLQKEQALAEASAKVVALENAKQQAEEAKIRLEASLQGEIARLREEKEEQSKAIESKFDALSQELKQMQKPQPSFWKKLFGVGSEPTDKSAKMS